MLDKSSCAQRSDDGDGQLLDDAVCAHGRRTTAAPPPTRKLTMTRRRRGPSATCCVLSLALRSDAPRAAHSLTHTHSLPLLTAPPATTPLSSLLVRTHFVTTNRARREHRHTPATPISSLSAQSPLLSNDSLTSFFLSQPLTRSTSETTRHHGGGTCWPAPHAPLQHGGVRDHGCAAHDLRRELWPR